MCFIFTIDNCFHFGETLRFWKWREESSNKIEIVIMSSSRQTDLFGMKPLAQNTVIHNFTCMNIIMVYSSQTVYMSQF